MKHPKIKLSRKNNRRLKAAGGIGLIAVGIPLIPLPIPIGWAVTLSGVAVLTNNSETAKRKVDQFVEKYPTVPRKFRAVREVAQEKAKQINPFGRNKR